MTNATVTAPATTTEGVKLGAKGFAAAQALAEARLAEAAAKKAGKAAAAILEEIVGTVPGTVATYRGVPVVKVQPGKNSKINREALLQGWPEAYAATYEETEYTFFKAV